MITILTGRTYGVFVHRNMFMRQPATDSYFTYMFLHRAPIYIPSDNDNLTTEEGDVL